MVRINLQLSNEDELRMQLKAIRSERRATRSMSGLRVASEGRRRKKRTTASIDGPGPEGSSRKKKAKYSLQPTSQADPLTNKEEGKE